MGTLRSTLLLHAPRTGRLCLKQDSALIRCLDSLNPRGTRGFSESLSTVNYQLSTVYTYETSI